MKEQTPRKRRAKNVLATVLLGETVAAGLGAAGRPPQICDPVPPPPTVTPTAGGAPTPPGGVVSTPTPGNPTATPTRTTTPTPQRTPTTNQTPPVICDPVPRPPNVTPQTLSRSLPLQERLQIKIRPVEERPHTYSLDANFSPGDVRWLVTGGTLELNDRTVVWLPPAKKGRYLLQVVVDAGPAGVAVDALTVEA